MDEEISCSLDEAVRERESFGYRVTSKGDCVAIMVKQVKPGPIKALLFFVLCFFVQLFIFRLYYFLKGTTYTVTLRENDGKVKVSLSIST